MMDNVEEKVTRSNQIRKDPIVQNPVNPLRPKASEDIVRTTGMDFSEFIKARIVVAQNIPRDLKQIKENLCEILEDKEVAKNSFYVLPRRGVHIEGLSISFIKELAREYGHLTFGVRVLEQGATYAKVYAYAIDLKTNTDESREWKVLLPKRVVNAKNSSEEIYKFIFAEGAKRMRSCIERVLPEHLKNFAKNKVKQALLSKEKNKTVMNKPLEDRFVDCVKAFQSLDSRITDPDVLELVRKARVEDIEDEDFVKAQGIYTSIKDGVVPVCEHFPQFKQPEPKEVEKKELKTELDKEKTDGFYKELE